MKTKKITITFTLEELRQLGGIIHNGWGGGDYAESSTPSQIRTMMRAMQKLSDAQRDLANMKSKK